MIGNNGADREAVVRHVQDRYGFTGVGIAALNLGADAGADTFRLVADGEAYFLKLRRDGADDTRVRLQDFLAAANAGRVLAPLPDRDGRLVTEFDGGAVVLYPFVDGCSGFATALTQGQWEELGAAVRALHSVDLPSALRAAVRVEAYGPQWRDKVRGHLATDPPPQRLPDAPARELAALLKARRPQLSTLVERAEQLAAVLRGKDVRPVLCHGDLHAGNVMVADDGSLVVVDWDEPVLAPRERDLMFIGGGVGGVWNEPAESAAFYRGYGAQEIDAQALAYYRCERIVRDIAEYCDQLLFGTPRDGDSDDHRARELSLRQFAGQFRPGDVVDIAGRTYAALRG
ncbi:phosphotransferase enzyme family protein [Streptomyces sp. NPDC055060]